MLMASGKPSFQFYSTRSQVVTGYTPVSSACWSFGLTTHLLHHHLGSRTLRCYAAKQRIYQELGYFPKRAMSFKVYIIEIFAQKSCLNRE
jgi:hypothetical protein